MEKPREIKDRIAKLPTSLKRRIPLKLLGKRFDKASRLVVSSKTLHNAIPTKNCDIVMTLPATTDDTTLMWLLARLRSRTPYLHVHVRHLRNTKVYGFYMTALYDNLLKGAEDLGIIKPLRQEYGGGKREFVYDEQQCFDGVDEEAGFLTSQERQSIVYHMLMNLRAEQGEVLGKVRFLEGQSIVPLLESKKIVTQVFPLHESQPLTDLRKSWVQSFCHRQPLDRICEYFGVKIAMYFAYLGHYTMALCFPTVLGITFWFIQGENEMLDSLCFVSFALFNVFWPTLYLEHWQRRTKELAYQWGTLDQKGELLQDPRPLYKGYLRTSPVTGRLEPFYPSWKRHLFRYFVSVPVIVFCLSVVFYIMLLIFELQEWVNELVKSEEIPSLCRFLPKILLAVAIGVLDEIYKKIAVWLNDMENYRMESSYENHLIIKLVLFQFVNSFLSLFYIAFYLQDMDRLRDQLAALLITRQVIGNLREAVIPFILWKLKLIKVGYDITAHMSPTSIENEIKSLEREIIGEKHEHKKIVETDYEKNVVANESEKKDEKLDEDKEHQHQNGKTGEKIPDKLLRETNHEGLHHRRGSESVFLPGEVTEGRTVKSKTDMSGERQDEEMRRKCSALILSQAEMESTMKEYEDTFDDYLEMFIQFGYVILFSSAFPLAALCALVNNIVEIRSDAFKLCMHHQRPFGKRVENIGIWQHCLGVMGFIAVIVNIALIGVSGQIEKVTPDIDSSAIFFIIVAVEHILLVVKLCITYAIPSVPTWIEQEMARLEFKRREALKRLESQEGHSHMIDKLANLSPVSEVPVPVPQRRHPSSLSSLPSSVLNQAAVSSPLSSSSTTSAGSTTSNNRPPKPRIILPISTQSWSMAPEKVPQTISHSSPSSESPVTASAKLLESENIQSCQRSNDSSERAGLRSETKAGSLESVENSQKSVQNVDCAKIPFGHRSGSVGDDSKSSDDIKTDSSKTARTSGITNQNIRQDIRQRILQSSGNRTLYGSRNEPGSKS